MPDFNFELRLNEGELEKLLEKEVVTQVQQLLEKIKPRIQEGAQTYVGEAIVASPEYTSLSTTGAGDNVTLREHFGLADPGPVLQRIVAAVQQGIVTELLSPTTASLGGIVVRILPNDYTAVLSVEGAEYVSQGRFRRSRGGRKIFHANESHPLTYKIPWLRWLLVEGAGIILAESEINTRAKFRVTSRTGRAIMVHPQARAVQGWGVPAQYAGTTDNNWLTRALADYQVGEKIISLFRKLLTV